MRFSTLVSLALFEGIAFGSTLIKCNADNCLGVMTNTPTVASSFCSTYLQPTTTITVTPTVTVSGTVAISPTAPTSSLMANTTPAHISSQCALATATPLAIRLSSACSCISVSPSSTITTTILAIPTTTILPTSTSATSSSSPTTSTSLAAASTVSSQPSTFTASYPYQTINLPTGTPVPCLPEINTPCMAAAGDVFNISCGKFYYFKYSYVSNLADIKPCIAACLGDSRCIAIGWFAVSASNPV